MTEFEKQLRDALALMDGVPVAGREARARMTKAESKILGLANTFATMEKEGRLHVGVKEEKPNEETDSERKDV